MPTGLYYSDSCLLHDTGDHPESKQRLQAIMQRLRASGELDSLSYREAPAAGLGLVKSVHSPEYVDHLVRLAARGGGWLDPDTVVSSGSIEAALHAVGGTVQAAVDVATGELANGFVAVRPPGHHAARARGMGFCLFNNIAIAARNLLTRGLASRVAIVDFDVHHGNGTQEVFYDDPSVLYFSTHQMPLYPGTGHYSETGKGPGHGYNVNVPLSLNVGDEGYLFAFESLLAPLLRRYRPDLLLVSAGYDAHWRDPLAGMRLTVPGFSRLTAEIGELARELCGGKVLFVLEGGYDLAALGSAVEATVKRLRGSQEVVTDPYGLPGDALGKDAVERAVEAIRRLHRL